MSRMVAQPAADPRTAIREEVRAATTAPGVKAETIFRLGAAAVEYGMRPEADAMFALAVRVLRQFIARGDAPNALALEGAIYSIFVKTIESEEHYERCFSQWRDEMAALGRSFAKEPGRGLDDAGGRDVAFVFHSGTVLGHTEVLFQLIRGRSASSVPPRIYTLFGQDANFAEATAARGIPVETYPRAPGGPHEWLRERIAANGERVAVWVSVPTAALFVLAARVAPVQVFWSLKHHPIRAPEIDGYITYGSWGERERVFHGQPWTVCPMPLALDPRQPRAQDVAALRARFPHPVLAGTLAREEKIASPPFLESVAAILERHPQMGYLWTGRSRHAGIDAFFRERGMEDRCHFVGWVDTPLYAAVLDLFLETFPFGCGITGYQAIDAGVPLLSYAEANTVFGMQFWEEAGAGRRPLEREALDLYPVLAARDPGEYVELASRLVDDPAFRESWRERERAFHAKEIADNSRYSQRFFATLEAIAASKARETPRAV